MGRKRILILGFGGTIAMVPDPASGVLKPAQSIKEILQMVPSLGVAADLELVQMHNLDSTNINPTHWTELAIRLAEVHESYDGIIITHGTDTMAYTATAVALALGRGLKIPVVFTGSQLPLTSFGADAKFNLENAMKTILYACEEGVCEIMIVFNDRVLRGCRTIKISESEFRAFDSPAFPYLSRITATGLSFSRDALRNDKEGVLDLQPHFQRGILVVELVPGIEPGILRAVFRSGKCRGLLLKSLGAGNVPMLDDFSIIPVIEEAVGLKIPVLVSTKFVGGNTHMDIYEPGKKALEAGAIPTGDLTDVAAQVKFMWALAQGYQEFDRLRGIIAKDFVGEITA